MLLVTTKTDGFLHFVLSLSIKLFFENIDALFGRWSPRLKESDYSTIPKLMKSFMDCERQLVIPHLIEQIPDFKLFVEGYLDTGDDSLHGHFQVQ